MIKKLHKDVIAKIAAGEVIHSPVNVVKELIENSLDAGATEIIVDVTDGGQSLIRVRDNGCGMSYEDLQLCYLPHTTSKLDKVSDLEDISTLGFRGEALHSICTVSNFEITSKSANDSIAHTLKISGGEFISQSICNIDTGTVISVSDLFFNLPVRKKFLNNASQEFIKITKLIQAFAFSTECIMLQLFHNSKLVLTIEPDDTLVNKVSKIYGDFVSNKLVQIEYKSETVSISGVIGAPQISTVSRDRQIVFINNRLIQNTNINKLMREVYSNLIFNKEFPFYILYINLPNHELDINIHPQKESISILNEAELLVTLSTVIKSALADANLQQSLYLNTDIYGGSKSNYVFNTLKDSTSKWLLKDVPENIAQVFDTYLIVETDEGVLFIDQHAAHESILYSQFLDEFAILQEQSASKDLLNPVIFDLSVAQSLLFDSYLVDFAQLGFVIESFGERTYKINSVPSIYSDHNIKELLIEVIDSNNKKFIDDLSKRTLAYLACRSAIKAGEKLTLSERSNLVKKLSDEHMYYTCPHGRPVALFINKSTFEKMFKRGI